MNFRIGIIIFDSLLLLVFLHFTKVHVNAGTQQPLSCYVCNTYDKYEGTTDDECKEPNRFPKIQPRNCTYKLIKELHEKWKLRPSGFEPLYNNNQNILEENYLLYCRKSIFPLNGTNYYLRTCEYDTEEKMEELARVNKIPFKKGEKQNVCFDAGTKEEPKPNCICNTDGCNSANKFSSSVAGIFLTALFSHYILKIY